MNRRSQICCACLACITALIASSAGACEHPSLVRIPPAAGISWNKYETLRSEVEHYLSLMEGYLGCVQAELEAAGGQEASFANLVAVRVDGAVAEMQAVVALYNKFIEDVDELARSGPP